MISLENFGEKYEKIYEENCETINATNSWLLKNLFWILKEFRDIFFYSTSKIFSEKKFPKKSVKYCTKEPVEKFPMIHSIPWKDS